MVLLEISIWKLAGAIALATLYLFGIVVLFIIGIMLLMGLWNRWKNKGGNK